MSFFLNLFKPRNKKSETDQIVQRPRPIKRSLKPKGYMYKTFEIIQMIIKIEESDRVDEKLLIDFLEEIPMTSNYLISGTLENGEIERKIIEIYNVNVPSSTCIGDHTQIIGLTDKCMISLSKNQIKQLDYLLKQSESV